MSLTKEGCDFWLISGWFIRYLAGLWLSAVNYYHKVLHLGCCSSPRSASSLILSWWFVLWFTFPQSVLFICRIFWKYTYTYFFIYRSLCVYVCEYKCMYMCSIYLCIYAYFYVNFKSKTHMFNEWKLYCLELKQKFIDKGHKSDLLEKDISAVEKLDRSEMLKEKVREKPKQTRIPLTLT